VQTATCPDILLFTHPINSGAQATGRWNLSCSTGETLHSGQSIRHRGESMVLLDIMLGFNPCQDEHTDISKIMDYRCEVKIVAVLFCILPSGKTSVQITS